MLVMTHSIFTRGIFIDIFCSVTLLFITLLTELSYGYFIKCLDVYDGFFTCFLSQTTANFVLRRKRKDLSTLSKEVVKGR